MLLHRDLATFLLSRESVTNPIVAALNLPATDPKVKLRVHFGKGSQNNQVPRLAFTGPFEYDSGNVAEGTVEEKIATFWFACYHAYLDDALDWISAIEADLASLFVPGYFANLEHTRIMSMIQVQGSKRPFYSDQAQITGKESPPEAATIAYRIAWQNAT